MHYLTTPAAASGERGGGEAGKRNKEDVKVRECQRLTALEIFHGCLQKPPSPFLSFFFLRETNSDFATGVARLSLKLARLR